MAILKRSAAVQCTVEDHARPEVFPSIQDVLWWAVMMLATIGHADMTPITRLGNLLAGFIVVFGIGVFALPTAILTAAIIYPRTERPTAACRHCERELE